MKPEGGLHIWTCLNIVALSLAIILNQSCEREKMPDKLPAQYHEVDSVMDIDSNIYITVKIGNQWWFAEDLKVTKYRNGDNISDFSQGDPNKWAQLQSGAYCSGVGAVAGAYYNWYAVNDVRGIAPEGWHVSTDEDWKELEQYIGMSETEVQNSSWRGTIEGCKLKITHSTSTGEPEWTIEDALQNTNEYGFSAVPREFKMFSGPLDTKSSGTTGFWWSISGYNEDMDWYRYLDYQYSGIFRYFGPKNYGFGVRCVKD